MSQPDPPPWSKRQTIFVLDVSGCGKSTVGRLLTELLEMPFLDAGDFHPPANIAIMRLGNLLDDAHRQPWLELLRHYILHHESSGD